MMNPKAMLQMKSLLERFRQNHPKVPMFLSAASGAIEEGSVIDVQVTTPDGRRLETNMRVTQDDLELFHTIGELAAKNK